MTAAVSAPPAVVGRNTLGALAGAEIRYAARSPLLWAGAAGSVALAWWAGTDGGFAAPKPMPEGYALWEYPVAPLAFTAFLAANAAALRDRPATTAELFGSTPARGWERTAGLLPAAVVPAVLALAVLAGQYLTVLARGGAVLGDGRSTSTFDPAPVELLGGPLAVACSFVAGVAVARLVRSRATGAVLGIVGWATFFVMFYAWVYAPFGLFAVTRSSVVATDLGMDPSAAQVSAHQAAEPPGGFVDGFLGLDRSLAFYGTHLVYVAGVTLTLAGFALARSGRDRRTRWVLAVGLSLVVLGLAGQLGTHEGDLGWLAPL
ncbi:hypothetical protein ACI797_08275 [Geodermatophilus sp. SYSU D00691]